MSHIETYFLDLIRGKKQGPFACLFRAILRIFSWFYGLFVGARNWAYDHGWARKYTPPVPVVISVGNIVAGGTGKTPVTLMLAQELHQVAPLAILSRGYRSKAENLSTPVTLSRGQGPLHPASYCGDEPYMLSMNVPKALVFVGKDRYKASNMAAKAGALLILLDDGMQHRSLSRDFEVVVIDALDPFGLGYFLPRGLLREGLGALSRADLIVLNHVKDHQHYQALCQKIGCYTCAPVVATKTEVAEIYDLKDQPHKQPLSGIKVGIFCGIAHPDYFAKTVRTQEAEIVGEYFIADHKEFDLEDLNRFAQKCKENGAEYLVCTEKDRVKLAEAVELSLPILWIRMRLGIVEGKSAWDAFIGRAKANLSLHL